MNHYSILTPRSFVKEISLAQLVPVNKKNDRLDLFKGQWLYKEREIYYSPYPTAFHGRKIEKVLKKIQQILSKINELQHETIHHLMGLKVLIKRKILKYIVKQGPLQKDFFKSAYGDIHQYETVISQLIDQVIEEIKNQKKSELVILPWNPLEIAETFQPLEEIKLEEKKEEFFLLHNYAVFIDDFAIRFLHPYITREICLESDPSDRLPFITQLFNAMEKTEKIHLSPQQKLKAGDLAILSYVKASIRGWCVNQLAIYEKCFNQEDSNQSKDHTLITIDKQIDVKKNIDIFYAALSLALKKDFPHKTISSTSFAALTRVTWASCDAKNEEIHKEVVAASKSIEVFHRVDKDHPQDIISKSALLPYLNKHNILFFAEENLTPEAVLDIEKQHKEQMRQRLNKQIFS
jgi:hypothetical protein